MSTLDSLVDPSSAAFAANAAHHRALAAQLRARIAQAALGGSESARQKHTDAASCCRASG
jgi:3-methylcrotonyl-CoA carboxylase beta subunit